MSPEASQSPRRRSGARTRMSKCSVKLRLSGTRFIPQNVRFGRGPLARNSPAGECKNGPYGVSFCSFAAPAWYRREHGRRSRKDDFGRACRMFCRRPRVRRSKNRPRKVCGTCGRHQAHLFAFCLELTSTAPPGWAASSGRGCPDCGKRPRPAGCRTRPFEWLSRRCAWRDGTRSASGSCCPRLRTGSHRWER